MSTDESSEDKFGIFDGYEQIDKEGFKEFKMRRLTDQEVEKMIRDATAEQMDFDFNEDGSISCPFCGSEISEGDDIVPDTDFERKVLVMYHPKCRLLKGLNEFREGLKEGLVTGKFEDGFTREYYEQRLLEVTDQIGSVTRS